MKAMHSIVVVFVLACPALARQIPEPDKLSILDQTTTNRESSLYESESAKVALNTVYGELSYLFILGNVSVNFERMLIPWLSARVGVGAGFQLLDGGSSATGMLVYHTQGTDHKLEAGLGITHGSYRNHDWWPSVTVGYRYQPQRGGFFFRAGANWTFIYGWPFQGSVGYSF